LFQQLGASFPRTYPFENVSVYEKAIGKDFNTGPLGFPCVFKFDWGGEGEGVLLLETAKDLEEAMARARRSEQSGQTGFLLQEYIPSAECSLRVVIMGDEIISYWRVQPNRSQFLTNLKAGATIDHDGDPELQTAGRDAVRALCRKTGINLAGLDLIFLRTGEDNTALFLEINYFFGRQGLGGSLKYYELVDKAVEAWLKGLGLSL
jgi:ribosomal protein S6--L-glutamate ligase